MQGLRGFVGSLGDIGKLFRRVPLLWGFADFFCSFCSCYCVNSTVLRVRACARYIRVVPRVILGLPDAFCSQPSGTYRSDADMAGSGCAAILIHGGHLTANMTGTLTLSLVVLPSCNYLETAGPTLAHFTSSERDFDIDISPCYPSTLDKQCPAESGCCCQCLQGSTDYVPKRTLYLSIGKFVLTLFVQSINPCGRTARAHAYRYINASVIHTDIVSVLNFNDPAKVSIWEPSVNRWDVLIFL